MTTFLWVASSVLLCLQWIFVHFSGLHPSPQCLALSAGMAIFGASFMLSWAAELAQFEIPQALALALLALIAVLPEYAVDMYFAWMAGKDSTYTAFATANMTGANRLLIGVGWAAVVFAFWLKTRRKEVSLEPEHKTEVLFLGLATLYSFFIPFKGRLDLFDAAIFIAIFVFYMRRASQAEHVEPELEGPAEVMAQWQIPARRSVTVAFFSAVRAHDFCCSGAFCRRITGYGPNFRHRRIYFSSMVGSAGVRVAGIHRRDSFRAENQSRGKPRHFNFIQDQSVDPSHRHASHRLCRIVAGDFTDANGWPSNRRALLDRGAIALCGGGLGQSVLFPSRSADAFCSVRGAASCSRCELSILLLLSLHPSSCRLGRL